MGEGMNMFQKTKLFQVSVFALCLLIVSIIATQSPSKEPEKPYKATTIDECLDERACLKYVFLREVIENYDVMFDSKRKDFRLKKWYSPVYFNVIGSGQENRDKAQQIANEVHDVLEVLGRYFGYRIEYTQDWQKINSILLYSPNLDQELKSNPSNFGFIKQDMMPLIQNSPFEYPKIMTIADEGKNREGLVLVKNTDQDNACIVGLITGYLGFNEYKSDVFGIEGYDDCSVTLLHKMVVSFLHADDLNPQASISEIETSFDNTYRDLTDKAAKNNQSFSEYAKQLSQFIDAR